MSTSRSRLTRAIQKIAEQSPALNRAIEATKARGDQAASAGVGTSDAERDRLCCDGSTSSNANPGADERDPSNGGQDGLNDDDPADISDMGPGELSGVTDCATGESICFVGNGWVPPEGWDGPALPPSNWPDDPESMPIEEPITGSEACAAMASGIGMVLRTGQNEWEIYSYGFGPVFDCTPKRQGALRAQCTGSQACPGGGNDFQGVGSIIYNAEEMETKPEWFVDIDSWPEDGCVNLAIKGGSIVGSKYDPENDGSYSKPMSQIELCDGEGNSILLKPSVSGGWKSIQSLDGEPDGAVQNGYLYSAQGDVIQQITPSEFSDPRV